MKIDLADSDESILSAFDAMKHLRNLDDASSFLQRVRELQEDGYLLVHVVMDGQVVAAAGFRLGDKIPWVGISMLTTSLRFQRSVPRATVARY